MLDNLKCKLGFHKPVKEHISIKHKYRTTNKGRSKKRYYTGVKELYPSPTASCAARRSGRKGN